MHSDGRNSCCQAQRKGHRLITRSMGRFSSSCIVFMLWHYITLSSLPPFSLKRNRKSTTFLTELLFQKADTSTIFQQPHQRKGEGIEGNSLSNARARLELTETVRLNHQRGGPAMTPLLLRSHNTVAAVQRLVIGWARS